MGSGLRQIPHSAMMTISRQQTDNTEQNRACTRGRWNSSYVTLIYHKSWITAMRKN